ncbi:MAG: integral membrane protein [Clostridiaceae bacterium BRH_c20a]|nr:MAG: integral membrane protein [Clostridiaceae bacterium BRH_c20a]
MNQFFKKEWPYLLFLVIPLVAAFLVYPYMPDMVPTHWNTQGEVDRYSSREFGTFFLPLLNIVLYVLFIVLPHLDPKRANYEKFLGSYRLIRYTTHIFFVFVFAITVFASLGYSVDIGLWVSLGVSLLFIVMGNIMGRVRHNYFVGFRYPWTLANEEVWRKTHQIGSKAMVLGGIIALIGVLLTENNARFIVLMSGIFIPTIFTTIYSYLVYKKISE